MHHPLFFSNRTSLAHRSRADNAGRMRPVRLPLAQSVIPDRRVRPPEAAGAVLALLLPEGLAVRAHGVGVRGLANRPVRPVALPPGHEARLERTPRRRLRRGGLAAAGSAVGLRVVVNEVLMRLS